MNKTISIWAVTLLKSLILSILEQTIKDLISLLFSRELPIVLFIVRLITGQCRSVAIIPIQALLLLAIHGVKITGMLTMPHIPMKVISIITNLYSVKTKHKLSH